MIIFDDIIHLGGMKMLAEERRQIILKMLKEHQIVKVQQICKKTHSSDSSVRRDLQNLEKKGLLKRIHGGAKFNYELQNEPDMFGKASQYPDAKQRIAYQAATHIKNDDVIFLDAGTTTLAIVDYIPQHQNITIVTNSILHAFALIERHLKTILLGGILKENTKAIIGETAISQLRNLNFNKAFLGINGIDIAKGYTTPDLQEAAIKREALKKSQQTFILSDESKLNKVSFVKVASIDEANLIIESKKNNNS